MVSALLVAAVSAQYIGSTACVKCHPARSDRSAHASALRRAGPHERLDGLRFSESNGVRYSYRNGQVTIDDGGRQVVAPLEWAFGSGLYATTYVGSVDGRWFEHRISFYSDTKKPDFTPGHKRTPPITLNDALGIFQSAEEMTRCFGCHATNVRPGPDLSAMTAGVQCERCHGPGGAHTASPAKNNILNSARFPAKAQVQICGECHRAPAEQKFSREPELDDPLSVRFQPVGLMASACFEKSGKLSCATCHDPHLPVSRVSTHYDAKCRTCHAGPAKLKPGCPRAPNCASCHMPKSTPVPHLTFTDHRIRVF